MFLKNSEILFYCITSLIILAENQRERQAFKRFSKKDHKNYSLKFGVPSNDSEAQILHGDLYQNLHPLFWSKLTVLKVKSRIPKPKKPGYRVPPILFSLPHLHAPDLNRQDFTYSETFSCIGLNTHWFNGTMFFYTNIPVAQFRASTAGPGLCGFPDSRVPDSRIPDGFPGIPDRTGSRDFCPGIRESTFLFHSFFRANFVSYLRCLKAK